MKPNSFFVIIPGRKGFTAVDRLRTVLEKERGFGQGRTRTASRGATSPTIVKIGLFWTKLAKIGAKPRQLGFVGILGKGYNPAGSTIPSFRPNG